MFPTVTPAAIPDRPTELAVSLTSLAQDLVTRFPQRSEGELCWYFAGSIVPSLLLAAGEFRTQEGETVKLSTEALGACARLARPIGDFDFVRVREPAEGEPRLGKGGVLSENDLSPVSRAGLKHEGRLFFDPLPPASDAQVVEIQVGGRSLTVSAPQELLRWKFQHAVEKADDFPKNGQIAADLRELMLLVGATTEPTVGVRCAATSVHAARPEYPFALSGGALPAEAAEALQAAAATLPGFSRLAGSTLPPDRWVPLARLTAEWSEADRHHLITVLEGVPHLAAPSEVNTTHPGNQELLRRHIAADRGGFSARFPSIPSDTEVASVVARHPWLFRACADELAAAGEVVHRSAVSPLLGLLPLLRREELAAELAVAVRCVEVGAAPALGALLRSDILTEPGGEQLRRLVVHHIRSQPGELEVRRAADAIQRCVDPIDRFDPARSEWVKAEPGARRDDLVRLLARG